MSDLPTRDFAFAALKATFADLLKPHPKNSMLQGYNITPRDDKIFTMILNNAPEALMLAIKICLNALLEPHGDDLLVSMHASRLRLHKDAKRFYNLPDGYVSMLDLGVEYLHGLDDDVTFIIPPANALNSLTVAFLVSTKVFDVIIHWLLCAYDDVDDGSFPEFFQALEKYEPTLPFICERHSDFFASYEAATSDRGHGVPNSSVLHLMRVYQSHVKGTDEHSFILFVEPQSEENRLNFAKWRSHNRTTKEWTHRSFSDDKAKIKDFKSKIDMAELVKRTRAIQREEVTRIIDREKRINQSRAQKFLSRNEPQIGLPGLQALSLEKILPDLSTFLGGKFDHDIKFSPQFNELVTTVNSILKSFVSTGESLKNGSNTVFNKLTSVINKENARLVSDTVIEGANSRILLLLTAALSLFQLYRNAVSPHNKGTLTFSKVFWGSVASFTVSDLMLTTGSSRTITSTIFTVLFNSKDPRQPIHDTAATLFDYSSEFVKDLPSMFTSIRSSEVRRAFDEAFLEAYQDDDRVESQGLDVNSFEDFGDKIRSLVVTYVVNAFPTIKFNLRQVKEMMSVLALFPRSLDGLWKVIDYIKDGIQAIVTFVQTKILSVKATRVFPVGNEPLDRWTKNVIEIVGCKDMGKLPINMETYNRVASLRLEADYLLIAHSKSLGGTVVKDLVAKYLRTLQPICDALSQANLGASETRMEPVGICITGASGVGKTQMSIPFVQDILGAVLPSSQREAFIKKPNDFFYQRVPEHEYWDGYRGQVACIFDDFMQGRDIAGNPDSEAMSIIRCAGNFPYICHMASLDQKGNTEFISSLLFASTNQKILKPQSINFPEAVVRRFDLTYECRVKAEYQKGGVGPLSTSLDKEKVELLHPGKLFVPEIYEFQEINLLTGDLVDSSTIDYHSLLAKAIVLYQKNVHRADALLKELLQRREYASRAQAGAEIQMDSLETQGTELVLESLLKLDSENCIYFETDSKVVDSIDSFEDLLNLKIDDSEVRDVVTESIHESVYYVLHEKDVDEAASYLSRYSESYIDLLQDTLYQVFCKHVFSEKRTSKLDDILSTYIYQYLKQKKMLFIFDKAYEMDVNHQQMNQLISKYLPAVAWQFLAINLPNWGMRTEKHMKSCPKCGFQRMQSFFSSTIDLCPSWKAGIIGTSVVVAALTAIAGGISAYKMLFEGKVVTQSPSERDFQYNTKRTSMDAVKKSRNTMRYLKPQMYSNEDHIEMQGATDETTDNLCNSIVKRNMYELKFSDNATHGKALCIEDNIFLMPMHFLCLFEDIKNKLVNLPDQVQFKNAISDRVVTVLVADITSEENRYQSAFFDDKDLFLVRIPVFYKHRSIVKHFVDKTYVETLKHFDLHYYSLRGNTIVSNKAKGDAQRNVTVYDDVGEVYQVNVAVAYTLDTRRGDCGSFTAVHTSNHRRGVILGLHVAGNTHTGRGYTSIINRQELERELREMKTLSGESKNEPQNLYVDDATSIPIVATLDKYPHRNFRTCLRKTDLHGSYRECKKAPASLGMWRNPDSGELEDVLVKSIRTYYRERPSLVDVTSKLAYNDLLHHLSNSSLSTNMVNSRLLSFEEAVVGVPEIENCFGMPMTTSPGWPYNLSSTSKRDIFGPNEAPNFETDLAIALRARVNDVICSLQKGEIPFLPFTGFIKDERRKFSKILEGSSRYVSACCLESYILNRIYFGQFVAAFQTAGMELGHTIGMDPTAVDWHTMALDLQSKDPEKIGDGDFKNFDASISVEIFDWMLLLIQEFYKDEHFVERRALWSTISKSHHILPNGVIQWNGGEPSGHCLTAPLNCLVNMFIFRYAWYSLMSSTKFVTEPFSFSVALKVMGDDNILNVLPEAQAHFNPTALTDVFASIGFTYTAAQKDSVGNFWKPLNEGSFLKRTFRFEERVWRYVAPLDLETILDIPMWYTKGNNKLSATKENVETCFKELSLHDDKTYYEWTNKIARSCTQCCGFTPFIPARISLMRVYIGSL